MAAVEGGQEAGTLLALWGGRLGGRMEHDSPSKVVPSLPCYVIYAHLPVELCTAVEQPPAAHSAPAGTPVHSPCDPVAGWPGQPPALSVSPPPPYHCTAAEPHRALTAADAVCSVTSAVEEREREGVSNSRHSIVTSAESSGPSGEEAVS